MTPSNQVDSDINESLPYVLDLTPDVWAAACVLAGLRMATNDSTRTGRRNQKNRGNRRNDLMGMMAELAGRDVLGRTMAHEGRVKGSLLEFGGYEKGIDSEGNKKGVDLEFVDKTGQKHRIEIKGNLRQETYYLFAISEEAHEESVSRHATGYVGVLMTPGGKKAIVSKINPLEDVRVWKPKVLNPERNDPALILPLQMFRDKYTNGLDVDTKAPPVMSALCLDVLTILAHDRLGEAEKSSPLSSVATAVQARDWALKHLHNWTK